MATLRRSCRKNCLSRRPLGGPSVFGITCRPHGFKRKATRDKRKRKPVRTRLLWLLWLLCVVWCVSGGVMYLVLRGERQAPKRRRKAAYVELECLCNLRTFVSFLREEEEIEGANTTTQERDGASPLSLVGGVAFPFTLLGGVALLLLLWVATGAFPTFSFWWWLALSLHPLLGWCCLHLLLLWGGGAFHSRKETQSS